MGYCNKKVDRLGQTRYTAMYRCEDGRYRSAGTFDRKKEATDAWQAAEAKVREGRGHHLVRGRINFEDYIKDHWLPNLTVEVRTLENYTYELNAHILEHFSGKQMINIRVIDIRRWLADLKKTGVSAATRKYLKTLLSSIFACALRDEVVPTNPCLLVSTEKVPKKALRIITPEQFDQFFSALVGDISKLLVEVAIETGMRWGELTELRVKDFDLSRCLLTVARAVVQVNRKFHPEGGRFLVKPPKDHEQRVLKIRIGLANKIYDHIQHHRLGAEDLLFWYDPATIAVQTPETEPVELGRTDPNEQGRTYRHGTLSAYTAGRCSCGPCKKVMAEYRRKRRANGKDQPRRQRRWDTDGHIPGRWFREKVIRPALAAAGLPVDIRMHLLRHAHASWLLNGGANLVDVKERLGHASIQTTERYLHTVDDYGEAAIAALEKVRGSNHPDATTLVQFLEGGPVRQDDLAKVSSKVLLEYLSTFQAEINRRVVENEAKVGAA